MSQIVKGPYLQWPTTTSMTIMWETSAEASSDVDIFETEKIHSGLDGRFKTREDTKRTVIDGGYAKIHRVEATGLKPGTSYQYRVRSKVHGGEAVESDLTPLRTAPTPDRPFSFAVFSEMGGANNADALHRLLQIVPQYRHNVI